ncbi:hypothetical protein B7494_g566 [Chlorociboria aeruginascens]|nr:hypothetical protein B7494_g566 [Chlorociboria aeruginascens]
MESGGAGIGGATVASGVSSAPRQRLRANSTTSQSGNEELDRQSTRNSVRSTDSRDPSSDSTFSSRKGKGRSKRLPTIESQVRLHTPKSTPKSTPSMGASLQPPRESSRASSHHLHPSRNSPRAHKDKGTVNIEYLDLKDLGNIGSSDLVEGGSSDSIRLVRIEPLDLPHNLNYSHPRSICGVDVSDLLPQVALKLDFSLEQILGPRSLNPKVYTYKRTGTIWGPFHQYFLDNVIQNWINERYKNEGLWKRYQYIQVEELQKYDPAFEETEEQQRAKNRASQARRDFYQECALAIYTKKEYERQKIFDSLPEGPWKLEMRDQQTAEDERHRKWIQSRDDNLFKYKSGLLSSILWWVGYKDIVTNYEEPDHIYMRNKPVRIRPDTMATDKTLSLSLDIGENFTAVMMPIIRQKERPKVQEMSEVKNHWGKSPSVPATLQSLVTIPDNHNKQTNWDFQGRACSHDSARVKPLNIKSKQAVTTPSAPPMPQLKAHYRRKLYFFPQYRDVIKLPKQELIAKLEYQDKLNWAAKLAGQAESASVTKNEEEFIRQLKKAADLAEKFQDLLWIEEMRLWHPAFYQRHVEWNSSDEPDPDRRLRKAQNITLHREDRHKFCTRSFMGACMLKEYNRWKEIAEMPDFSQEELEQRMAMMDKQMEEDKIHKEWIRKMNKKNKFLFDMTEPKDWNKFMSRRGLFKMKVKYFNGKEKERKEMVVMNSRKVAMMKEYYYLPDIPPPYYPHFTEKEISEQEKIGLLPPRRSSLRALNYTNVNRVSRRTDLKMNSGGDSQGRKTIQHVSTVLSPPTHLPPPPPSPKSKVTKSRLELPRIQTGMHHQNEPGGRYMVFYNNDASSPTSPGPPPYVYEHITGQNPSSLGISRPLQSTGKASLTFMVPVPPTSTKTHHHNPSIAPISPGGQILRPRSPSPKASRRRSCIKAPSLDIPATIEEESAALPPTGPVPPRRVKFAAKKSVFVEKPRRSRSWFQLRRREGREGDRETDLIVTDVPIERRLSH